MQPPTLSASGLKNYEECPASFEAQYVQKVRVNSGGGGAGDLGSALHEDLEHYVEHHLEPDGTPILGDQDTDLKGLLSHFDTLVPKWNLDPNQTKQARAMLTAWLDRWYEDPPFQVLSWESKETFPLKVMVDGDVHEVPVTYIMDRVDLMPDGSIRVVDYKSWMQALNAEEIKYGIQGRIYALAAAIKYKTENPPYIWVEFDQLRYGRTAVRYDRDDIKETWTYLKAVFERIVRDDGSEERVGPSCRWCVRAITCESLDRAMQVGSILSIKDPETIAYRLAELNAIEGVIRELKPQLQEAVYTYLEEKGLPEHKFHNGVKAKVTPKRQREVNSYQAAMIVGPDIAATYGKIGVTAIDELVKGTLLTDDQKEALLATITEGVTTSTNATFPKK